MARSWPILHRLAYGGLVIASVSTRSCANGGSKPPKCADRIGFSFDLLFETRLVPEGSVSVFDAKFAWEGNRASQTESYGWELSGTELKDSVGSADNCITMRQPDYAQIGRIMSGVCNTISTSRFTKLLSQRRSCQSTEPSRIWSERPHFRQFCSLNESCQSLACSNCGPKHRWLFCSGVRGVDGWSYQWQ